MAATNTRTSLNSLFKEVYGNYHMLLPEGFRVQTDMPFRTSKKLGDVFVENVLLAHEHGVTYAGASDDSVTMITAEAGQTRGARIQGTQIIIRSRIGYNAASSATGGEESFRRAFDVVVENMTLSGRKRLEIDCLYGQDELATIEGTAATSVITINDAEWAPGLWAGMEGAKLEIYSAAGTDARGTAVSPAEGAIYTISSVDLAARTVTLTGTVDFSADGIIAGDRIFFRSQRTESTENSMKGIHAILGTETGNLFDVPVDGYSLWSPSQHSTSGTLSYSDVGKAVVQVISKGLDEGLCLYINPSTWADLADAEATRISHDQQMKGGQVDVGADGIKFYSQNGGIVIKSSIYVKEGYGYMIPPSYWERIGATDLTFSVMGEESGYFLWVQDETSYELRQYSNQAIFSSQPGKGALITGIVNA